MSSMRKAYPPEFKAQAVLLAREDGAGEGARRRLSPRPPRRRPSRTSLAVGRARFRPQRRSSCVRYAPPDPCTGRAVAGNDVRYEFYRRKHTTRGRFGRAVERDPLSEKMSRKLMLHPTTSTTSVASNSAKIPFGWPVHLTRGHGKLPGG